jgi:outer membrane receptor protein involved in Fe transport
MITISRDDIARSGYTNIGQLLLATPQSYGGESSPQIITSNAPTGDGNPNLSAISSPNLRGLGPESTLTLLDGRRLPQGLPSGAADISFIPLDAIERIEIITDGASAIYGSDAVAGVVNVILRKNYDGASIGYVGGQATDGGAGTNQVNASFGKTWSSGSATVSYQHSKQDLVDASQRSFTQGATDPFTLLPSNSADSVLASASQSLGSSVSAFVQGYYTKRSVFSIQSYSFLPFSIATPTDFKQYSGTMGFDLSMPGNWRVSAYGMAARQETSSDIYGVTIPNPARVFDSPQDLIGTTRTVEVDANGPLFDLPTGAVKLAVGGGYRHEGFNQTESYVSIQSQDTRNVRYVFAEALVPLVTPGERPRLHTLDATLSARNDHYSDFGGTTVPKIGLLYRPVRDVAIRASWGKSFHAPSLSDAYGKRVLNLVMVPDPLAASGQSILLDRSGGNPGLRPERSTSSNISFEFQPTALPGFLTTVSYFHIDYQQRIGTLQNYPVALTDPTYSPFIIRNPSAALQAAWLADAGGQIESNNTPYPYDPATVAAAFDNRVQNVSQQMIDGVDFGVNYTTTGAPGRLDLFSNIAYLNLRERITQGTPEQTLTGTAFNPPRFKARGGATWSRRQLSATAILNFLGDETNTYQPGSPHVSSWTTLDTSLTYIPTWTGLLDQTHLTLAVQNVFNSDPPHVEFNTFRKGINYDSTNVTPLGRFISVQVFIGL